MMLSRDVVSNRALNYSQLSFEMNVIKYSACYTNIFHNQKYNSKYFFVKRKHVEVYDSSHHGSMEKIKILKS